MAKNLTNKYRKEYESKRNQKWKNLSDELKRYQEEYSVTTTELANGLSISRQSLYNFFEDPAKGLPIERVDIFALCDFISNPEKNLKLEYKQKRKDFKKDNLNRLLSILNFLPDENFNINQNFNNDFDQIKNPQVRRVLYRLNSNWIKGEELRTSLASMFLDMINESGRLKDTSKKELLTDLETIKNLPEKEFSNNYLINKTISKKYRQEINKLFNSGKTKYAKSELYELYQSIYEHEIINEHKSNHLTIIDCQFRSISNPIDGIKLLNSEVADIFIESEQNLVNSLKGQDKNKSENIKYSHQDRLDSVIEVAIKCNLSYEGKSHPDIIWRYSSTASHIRNMLASIKKGLGYPFEVSSFSVRTLGFMDMSLIRSEVMITDPENKDQENKQVYQGWWVDINKIMGTLRAVIDAFKRWLSAQTNTEQRSDYYSAFQELAEIDERLFISRASFYSPKPQFNKELLEECKKKIEAATKYISKYNEENKYFKRYKKILEKKGQLASLTEMHIFLLEGNIQRASSCLGEAEIILDLGLANKEEPFSDNILFLNASSCVMFYKLLIGDKDFIENRHWRDEKQVKFNVEYNMNKLSEYIQHNCCIDIDSYLYASQFFGTIGYLEFYISNDCEDITYLKKAIKYLLDAAHYAFRIGHTKRGIHWLAYVSRIYCRLNNITEAEKYLELAKKIGIQNYSMNQLGDIEPLMFYPEFSQIVYSAIPEKDTLNPSLTWSISNLNLAEGEVYFLKGKNSENNPQDNYKYAENYFIKSLKNSMSTGFSRLAADSIYNLYRLSNENYEIQKIKIKENDEKTEILKKRDLAQNLLDKEQVESHENPFNEKLNTLIEEINLEKYDKRKTLKKCTQEIWNNWSLVNNQKNINQTNEHIFSQEIEKSRFLSVLD